MRGFLDIFTVTLVVLGLLGAGYAQALKCDRGCCCMSRTENSKASVPIQARGHMRGCGCVQPEAGPGAATLNTFLEPSPGGTVPARATAAVVPSLSCVLDRAASRQPVPCESPPIYKLASSYLC